MKVKDLIKKLQEFNPESKVQFAQANGDVNFWCDKAAIQLAYEPDEENLIPEVEIIIIQEW